MVSAVSGELARRATALGYDPRRVIERLDNGSFVSATRRYMYVETPKAACSSFKHLIAGIEGLQPDFAATPAQRETRPDMLVHQRRLIAMPTLLSVDAVSRDAILARAPGWLTFAIVRNPFSRLVSFFEHKVRLGEPGYGPLEARYGDFSRFGGRRQTFTRFVEEVVAGDGLRALDTHLLPQGDTIMPRLIPYTHIFRLEAVEDAVRTLREHLGMQFLPLAHNRTAGRDWRAYYEERSAALVAKAYQGDFDQFGYDQADWRCQGDAPETSPDEEHWRREIVARNAMLEMLYDKLAVPPAYRIVEITPPASRL